MADREPESIEVGGYASIRSASVSRGRTAAVGERRFHPNPGPESVDDGPIAVEEPGPVRPRAARPHPDAWPRTFEE